MKAMTLTEAKAHDFLGAPEVHENPINGLVTVRYHICGEDENGITCELSEDFVLTSE